MVKHAQTTRRLLPTSSLSLFDYIVGLVLKELTSHCTVHYLCSEDLSKSFSQFIMSIFILSHYFFHRFCLVEKCRVTSHCLCRDSTLIVNKFSKITWMEYFTCKITGRGAPNLQKKEIMPPGSCYYFDSQQISPLTEFYKT